MKKLIGFRQLKANCAWEIIQNRGTMYDCGYLSSDRVKCTARNCPVWKKLETPEKGLVEMWQMASSYLVLCHLCAHNTQDDQICDHTGQDKRGLKSCDYRQFIGNV
jgi:hypothetical protein